MDVLWLRLSKSPNDPDQTLGRMDAGRIFVMLDRDDYWQCAFVIPKGGIDAVHARGLEAFRDEIARLAPYLRDRVHELASWDDVKLLTVAVNRLDTWFRPGLLFIGDAAHAMSPVGGVGINLAIQDAVAAANILVPPPAPGRCHAGRSPRGAAPPRMADAHDAAHADRDPEPRHQQRAAAAPTTLKPPWPVRMLGRYPALRRLPARIIGMGFRPEHIRH